MKKFQEALGHSPDIFVAHGEHTQARENDDDTFRKLNGGDGAHAFDVRGIVDSGMRDSGMHSVRILYPARTLARNSSTISSAALWAASLWVTSNEIAPTRAWPPPP